MQKLSEKMKSEFKRTINWNKYHWKVTIERQNQYLDGLIDPNFWGVNRLFVLPFEYNNDRARTHMIFFSECKDKSLECYNRWPKRF